MCQRCLKHNFGSLSGLSGHLSADASIIVDLTFEKAAIQIVNAATSSECQCPWCSWHAWRHSSPSGGWVLLPPEDQYQCKRRTTSNDNIACQYSSLDILSNMSVSCEGLFSAEGHHNNLTNTRQSTSWAVFEALADPVEGQLLRVELQTMSRVMRLSMWIDFATPYGDAATITSVEVDTDEVGPQCVLHYWLLEHQLHYYPHLPTASPLSSFFQVQQDCSCCCELLEQLKWNVSVTKTGFARNNSTYWLWTMLLAALGCMQYSCGKLWNYENTV